jgi:hypothetical protein
MRSHEERKTETERLLALLPQVRPDVLRIPGVSNVAVGLRERGGKLTDEIVLRVHVDTKLPESQLPRADIIPKSLYGVAIDVIVKRMPTLLIGFLNDEEDEENYSPLAGGMRISAQGDSDSQGTLGCFCRRVGDGKTVLLTNYHVLIHNPYTGVLHGKVGFGVGQSKWRRTCCCVCNRVATILDFRPYPLDCAIAELDKGIKAAFKIRRVLRKDNTVEEEGRIAGSGVPIVGDEGYKTGWRTGLTRGLLTEILPTVHDDPEDPPPIPFTRVEVTALPPFTKMINGGDSGSVFVSGFTGDVIALLNSGSTTHAYGCPIRDVEEALGIEVLKTPDDVSFAVADSDGESEAATVEPPCQALVDALQHSAAGRALLGLFDEHREEAITLVESRRRFTVAWQRSEGPAFLAALTRSARDPIYRIPRDIRGISRGDATHHIAAALRATGSPSLIRDLDAFGSVFARALAEGNTVDEVLAYWEAARLRPRAVSHG